MKSQFSNLCFERPHRSSSKRPSPQLKGMTHFGAVSPSRARGWPHRSRSRTPAPFERTSLSNVARVTRRPPKRPLIRTHKPAVFMDLYRAKRRRNLFLSVPARARARERETTRSARVCAARVLIRARASTGVRSMYDIRASPRSVRSPGLSVSDRSSARRAASNVQRPGANRSAKTEPIARVAECTTSGSVGDWDEQSLQPSTGPYTN
jgi:hypothetical protein